MVQEYRAKDAPPPSPPNDREPPAGKGPHKHRWVFHGVPVTAPGGHVPFQIPEEFADDLGRHLTANGFYHRDELIAKADPDGKLDVSTLPPPSLRHDPPLAGPEGWLNPGPWVPASSPPPAPRLDTVLPIDPEDLSDAEADALKVEADAMQDVLRRREQSKMRRAEADPHVQEVRRDHPER